MNTAYLISGEMSEEEWRKFQEELERVDHSAAEERWRRENESYERYSEDYRSTDEAENGPKDPCDELFEKYEKLQERIDQLYDERNDSQAEAYEYKQRLNELEMYEEWREKCRKETLRFRIFDRTWWEFFFYYAHIVLGKD